MEKNLINSKKNYKKLYLKYKKKYNLLKGGSGFSDEDTSKAIENSLKDQENILQRYVMNPTPQLSENLSKFGLKINIYDDKKLKKLGMNTLLGAWATNLQVRPEKDWENLKGRAVT